MKKITWSYLNSLFDHRFKDTLSENNFLHCVKGLHLILDEKVQKKYDVDAFGKKSLSSSIHAPSTMDNSLKQDTDDLNKLLLLQQRHAKNRDAEKSKSTSYDKTEVKDILAMASQLSDKLDIPIMDAFD
ncbi:hypothetical protein AX15_006095 [Amanita polypyramis BW_CC]|nr:hypothetical protein AX15_006095 [Amanita polypyramis BW_CC]